jgi:hypothetical protein
VVSKGLGGADRRCSSRRNDGFDADLVCSCSSLRLAVSIQSEVVVGGDNQRQLLEYWNDVVYEPGYCDRRLEYLEVFAGRGFMPVFKLAEEMTAENRIGKGYVGISLGLLRRLSQYELLKIKDMAGKTNSKGEPLLKYYEPDHERLRKGAWAAA